jgi:hypothetical protein
MEINIDRIKSRFDGKVRNEEIIKLYNQFKKIDDVLSLDYGIEETIVKFLKCRLNINLCKTEINQRSLEIKGYENEIKLLNRSGFDSLRQKGKLLSYLSNYDNDILDTLHFMGCILGEEVSEIKLDRFRKRRDETNRNYNELNIDGNVSVSSNINSWV